MPIRETGYKIYTTLKERRVDTLEFTGETKPNTEGDEDYIAPVLDPDTCTVGEVIG